MATSEIKILIQAVDKATSIFGKIGQKLEGLGQRFGKLGSIASVAGGFIVSQFAMRAYDAVQDFVKGSIEAFANFENTLTTITAISGKTGAEAERLYEQLEQAAHTAGLQFAVGANKAAQALESLVKAGLEGEEAVKALNAALAMAQIEGIEAAQASDMLVGVMNQFHYSASEATKVVDTLVNASMVGIDTAEGFATALSYCGATASSLGFSLQETAAALVAINNQGIEAEKAGRYLNAMFEALIKNSDKLGFSIYDSSGRMLNLKQIIGKLTVKLESFGTQAERDAYLNRVFGRQAARAALSLLNLSDGTKTAVEKLAEYERQMDKNGTAMTVVGEKLDTLKGAQMKLAAATERLQILFGKALAPVVSAVADFISRYFIPAIEWLGARFMDLWNAIKPVADFLYWLAVYIIQKYVIPAFQWLADVLKPVTDALGTVASWIGQAWDWICNAVGQATETIKNALGMTEEAHEELAETVETATEEVAESYEENFGLAELKAEEFQMSVEEIAENLMKQYGIMKAETAKDLASIAKDFDEAFKAGRFEEAAEIIKGFADEYGITWQQAENIIRDFNEKQQQLLEEQAEQLREALQEQRETLQEHMEWLKQAYFKRCVQDSDEFLEDLRIYGETYNALLGSSLYLCEAVVSAFAKKWELTWEKAAEILEEYVQKQEEELEKMKEDSDELVTEVVDPLKEAIDELAESLEADFNLMQARAAKTLPNIARQFKEVFEAGRFKKAAQVITDFANQYSISFDQAERIIWDFIDQQKQALQKSRQNYRNHLEWLKTQYFKRYVENSEEFLQSVKRYAKAYNNCLEHGLLEGAEFIVTAFSKRWELTWEKAAQILENYVEKQDELLKEQNKSLESQLLERAQKNFEKFKECVTSKAFTLQTDVTGEMSNLANNVTELIKAGLVGEAQKQMQAYVECSTSKAWNMVEQIDNYMAELTEKHREKIRKMREYADKLTGEERKAVLAQIGQMTLEYQMKISQLAEWKELLMQQMKESGITETAVMVGDVLARIDLLAAEYEDKLEQLNEKVREAKEDEKDIWLAEIHRLKARYLRQIEAFWSLYQKLTKRYLDETGTEIENFGDEFVLLLQEIGAKANDIWEEIMGEILDKTEDVLDKTEEVTRKSKLTLKKVGPITLLPPIPSPPGFKAPLPRLPPGYAWDISGASSVNVSISGPLVNIEGNADRRTAELAAKLVEKKLYNVIVEASSSGAPTTHKRIRIGSKLVI